MTKAEKILIENSQDTIKMCRAILGIGNIPPQVEIKLQLRLTNCEQALHTSEQDIAIRSLRSTPVEH